MTEQQPQSNRSLIIVLGVVGLIIVLLLGGLFVTQSREDTALEAGKTAVANGQWEEAVDELTAVINTSPPFLAQHTTEATALRGVAYYHTGDFDNALEDFDGALSQNEGFIDAYVYRAGIYYQAGEQEKAALGMTSAVMHQDVLDERLTAHMEALAALLGAGGASSVLAEHADQLPDRLVAQLAYTVAQSDGSLPEAELALAIADHLTEEQQAEMWVVKTAVLATTPDRIATQASIEKALTYEALLDENQLGQLYLAQAQAQLANGNWQEAGETAGMALEQDETLALAKAILAYQHYRQEEFAEAISFAEDSLALEENALAFYVSGAIAAWSGQFEAAEEQLNTALELNPTHIPSLAMRAYIHNEMNHWDALLADAEEAFSINPTHPDALWAQAMADSYQYDDETAYLRLSQAIALDDTRAEYYIFRSHTTSLAYQLPLRTADIDEAVALAPERPLVVLENFYRQYLIEGKEGEPEEAEQLMEMFPDHYAGPMMLANYYLWRTDELDTALEYAQTAVDKHSNKTTLMILGEAFYTQGEFEQAKEVFETALSLSPNSLSARRALVRYYNRQENQAEVERLIEEMFDIYPDSISARVLSSVYNNDDDPEQSWQLINGILADDPEEAGALTDIAITFFINGQTEEAIQIMDDLIDQYPYTANYWRVRAILNYQLDEIDAAIEDTEMALALEPANKSGYVLLTEIALSQDDVEGAVDYAEEAVDWPFLEENDQFTLARAYTFAGESDQALEILAEIEANSDDPDTLAYVYFSRAVVYGNIEGDIEQAREQLNTILEGRNSVTFVALAEEFIGDFIETDIVEQSDGTTTYTDSTNGFKITVPQGWEFVPVEDETILISAVYETPFVYAGFDLALTEIIAGAFTVADIFETLNPDDYVALELLTIGDETVGLIVFDLEDSPVRVYQYIVIQGDWLLLFNLGSDIDSIDQFTDDLDLIFTSFSRLEE